MGEREELLAAVRARLEQVAATGDSTAILSAPARAEAHRLTRCVGSDINDAVDMESVITLGWLHYRRALALPPAVAGQDRRTAVHFFAGCFIAGVDDLPPQLLPSVAEVAASFATKQLSSLRSSKEPVDYTRVVSLLRRIVQSLPDDHPVRAACLSHLGIALFGQYMGTSLLADLEEAVEMARAAIRGGPSDPEQAMTYLNNLGVILRARFDRSGTLTDLDEAVDTLRTAVRMSPDNDPHRTEMLYQLGLSLGVRYELTGALEDVDEEVDLIRGAARTVSDDDPDRARYLSALGGALLLRNERTGVQADLDEAVEACRAANRAVSHQAWPMNASRLGGLGLVLVARFQRAGALTDLDEGIEALRGAVRAVPDNNPFSEEDMQQLRFYASLINGHGELDEAVLGAAFRTVPDPERAISLFNLGSALLTRFRHTNVPTDLDEAVEMIRTAARRFPDDHSQRVTCMFHLGHAMHERFIRDGVVEDLEEAFGIFLSLAEAETAPPRIRVTAARSGARLVASSDLAWAAELLEKAVRLLPQLVPRRLQRGDQQDAIGRFTTGLAADATALALADTSVSATDRAVRALRLAEAGRAVLLSQTLDTRTDLTELGDQHTGLAERFVELRMLLDRDVVATASAGVSDRNEATRGERHRLAEEMEALLERIRACEGFADFGLPPTVEDLMAEAEHSPVVTFNVSAYRSDALLLTRDGISSCSLPGLTHDAVKEQVSHFYGALAEATSPDGERRIAAQRTLRQVLEWLWEAALEPVLSALEAQGDAISPARDVQSLPRVWWAVGGLLGLLPLHAAGFHTDPGQGPNRRTVMDRVISSYTPTIRALRHARARRPRPTGQSLIVAMPTTPGHSTLRYVPEEVRRVKGLLSCPVELIEPDAAPDGTPVPPGIGTPTTATVLAHLPQCAIAHFACHGASNHADPSQSQLLLHDHATTPLTVSALAQTDLAHAQLAYLSACSTADPGSSDLLDEAIHLTSAFQLAGFPHVIGTLWPIYDHLAVEIAESFYARLTPGPPGRLNPALAATALHDTIRAVRDRYPATPSLWAAYLHAGA
jgi:tetratricopeptide (TPR) repeat protein